MENNQRPPAGKKSAAPPPRRNQFWPILLIALLGFYLSLLLVMVIGFSASFVARPITSRIFKKELKMQREYY